jgi:hypothetical protein
LSRQIERQSNTRVSESEQRTETGELSRRTGDFELELGLELEDLG